MSPKNSLPNTALSNSIDPAKWGVSFSIKQCHDLGVDPGDTLEWLLSNGFRRFRLMSYWNEHEKQQGTHDFTALDQQLQHIAAAGGVVTLCLGARQPRWPENHWPDWAWQMTKRERTRALLTYLEAVVGRYRDNTAIISWQLENEALLANFGERPEIDRSRLRAEYRLVKRLDSSRPTIMTTSNSWGIPLRRPLPDVVGFSFYQSVYASGQYKITPRAGWIDPLRAGLIRLVWQKPTVIHELQCEPWGPKAIWEMSMSEQDKSMGLDQIQHNIQTCQKSGLFPMDLWGGEWWYWRHVQGDNTIWEVVKKSICYAPGSDSTSPGISSLQ